MRNAKPHPAGIDLKLSPGMLVVSEISRWFVMAFIWHFGLLASYIAQLLVLYGRSGVWIGSLALVWLHRRLDQVCAELCARRQMHLTLLGVHI